MDNQSDIENVQNTKKTWIIASVSILIVILFFVSVFLYASSKKNSDKKQVNTPSELIITQRIPVFKQNEPFEYEIKRKIGFRGNFKKLKLSVAIPSNVNLRQKVSEVQITPAPDEIVNKDNKRMAVYNFKQPPSVFNITLKGSAAAQTYTIEKAMKLNKNIDGQLSERDLKKYTSPENKIESDSFKVKKAAKSIRDGKSRIETVKNIFDFVDNKLTYDKNLKNSDRGANAAVFAGSGTSNEFAALFAALCRAKNIPARVVRGYSLPFEDNVRKEYDPQAWVEVWFDEYGWVNFDPIISYDEKINSYIRQNNLSYFDIANASSSKRNYMIYDHSDIHIDYDADDSSGVGMTNDGSIITLKKKN